MPMWVKLRYSHVKPKYTIGSWRYSHVHVVHFSFHIHDNMPYFVPAPVCFTRPDSLPKDVYMCNMRICLYMQSTRSLSIHTWLWIVLFAGVWTRLFDKCFWIAPQSPLAPSWLCCSTESEDVLVDSGRAQVTKAARLLSTAVGRSRCVVISSCNKRNINKVSKLKIACKSSDACMRVQEHARAQTLAREFRSTQEFSRLQESLVAWL